ncbi:cytochrome P450 [Mycobacterium sp. SMC-4]|uniref:cytochrome P450 n=1 Tax=Mycobacterium sp. SMC-4 TaxID=2857059 RepID=UPI0021B1613C|nr:cytochrome P450 [Mycobacterium sp. SMC-4]UXA19790.1 cytochrome P450 [Mycobacterium sp. SMC-4]
MSVERLDSLDDASFVDPAIQQKPFAYYRTLRYEAPVHFEKDLGMYLVSRHEDLTAVMRDPVVFSQELGYYQQMAHGHLDAVKEVLQRHGGGFFPDVANIDPPRHTRVRRLLSQAFSRKRMRSLEPQFQKIVDDLIDGFSGRGNVDGLHELALPMAIAFSMQQLQVDDLDMSTIKKWGSAYLSQFSLTNTREDMLRAAHELAEMQNYLIALVRRRMDSPEDDMLSDIIRAETQEEEPLSFEELVATARALLINTHDSMSTAFANILFHVATDAGIATHFYDTADDDAGMGRFIEELLRLDPPVRALSRVTTEAVTLGGTELPKGAHLLVLFASANDDESVFECPRQFDPSRVNLRKSLTFGAGVHLCLGVSLARMQLLVAARQTARRLRNLSLGIPVDEIRYLPNAALLAMESLPLTFTPESKGADR